VSKNAFHCARKQNEKAALSQGDADARVSLIRRYFLWAGDASFLQRTCCTAVQPLHRWQMGFSSFRCTPAPTAGTVFHHMWHLHRRSLYSDSVL